MNTLILFLASQCCIDNNPVHKYLIDKDSNLKKANIPNIVIEKFLDWNAKRHDYIMTVVSDINSSDIVNSVVEKEYLILSILKETAYFTLIDAEKTLKTLNRNLLKLRRYNNEEYYWNIC